MAAREIFEITRKPAVPRGESRVRVTPSHISVPSSWTPQQFPGSRLGLQKNGGRAVGQAARELGIFPYTQSGGWKEAFHPGAHARATRTPASVAAAIPQPPRPVPPQPLPPSLTRSLILG